MKFPWANTLLLAFIAVELASGLGGLMSGSPGAAVFIQVHRVAGYGILVLLIWKGANVAFSLRWRRRVAPRTASLMLAAALLGTLALGFSWSFVGPFTFAWFSGVSWHIYVGVALAPILVWHSLYHTRGLPVAFWAERRSFLRMAGLAAVGIAAWQLGELGARAIALNGATRRFTGSYEAGSFSGNGFPRTSWLNDRPARVDVSRWRLTVRGAVGHELDLTLDDLGPDSAVEATIDCTGGWHSTQIWRGMPVADLLERAGPSDSAASVTFRSVTGYYRRFSLAEARSYLLATGVGDETLSHGHGFPLRLVAPGKRGFDWVKWVEAVEVNESSKWWQPPLPLQ